MLSAIEAKRVGIKACIDKLGYDFCRKYADNSTSAWGEDEEGIMNCFVGVSTKPAPIWDITKEKCVVLTSEWKWPYAARCNVYMETGEIEFTEFRTPFENHSDI